LSASGKKTPNKQPKLPPEPPPTPKASDSGLDASSVALPTAIITTDRDLNIRHWNKAAETLFGWPAAEVMGKSAVTLVRTQLLENLNRPDVLRALTAESHWTGEVRQQCRDGAVLKTLASIDVTWDGAGQFNGLISVHQPLPEAVPTSPAAVSSQVHIDAIVEARTKELLELNHLIRQELDAHKHSFLVNRESEGRNRDLVDNIKLGIFRCTPGAQGRFIEINKALEEITGYTRLELLSINVCELYSQSLDGASFTNDININDWKTTREFRLRRKDGRESIVAMTVLAIRYDSGTVRFFDGILEDVTERKQAQAQIQLSLQRLQKTIREIIEAMAYIGEVRDPYTAGHQRRVAQLSFEIAKIMGLMEEKNEGLTMAAFVHDIGKILVPADILSKPGKLTKPEFDLLKDHTRVGYDILKTIEFPWPIATIVLQHHERLDGSGYPAGLCAEQIIPEARILAVADVVEAMSSHRPYRPALGVDRALEEINLHRGTLYDPNVVDACIKLFHEKNFNLN
jgi:PAS domain S-box-containing protein